MALWGLSVADRPLATEGKTAVMRFICVAGREMVNAGHETSMAKHDFSISGFETIANAVAAENCRYGIHFIRSAPEHGRTAIDPALTALAQALPADDQSLTAEDHALYSSNVQPNAAATTSGTKIMAFCCPFS